MKTKAELNFESIMLLTPVKMNQNRFFIKKILPFGTTFPPMIQS